MEIVTARHAGDITSTMDLRNLGVIAHTAQMQYQRQIKTLQALHKQVELTVENNVAWRERERRREEKYMQIDMERQAQREQLVENSNRVAGNRAARLEAAMRHEEAMRAAAAAKVHAVEDRLARFEVERADHALAERQRAAAVAARREAVYRTNLQILEERRQSILTKEHKVEDMLRQRHELRQLQAQIKAEEDFLREHQRRAIKAKAEGDLADRVAAFHAKNTAKDQITSRRKQALDDLSRARADELRQRFEYIAAQANEAAGVAEAERQMLAGKVEGKTARGEALAAQRAALLAEMQNLRQQMQRQEDILRTSLQRLRQTGSVTLPEEVVRSLEGLQAGGPVMATAVLGGGRIPYLLEGGPSSASVSATPRSQTWSGGRPRPRSAGPTPRTARAFASGAGHVRNGRVHMAPGTSPGTSQTGKARRRAVHFRAQSAGSGYPQSPAVTTAPGAINTPATPATPAPSPVPTPYAPYTAPVSRHRGRHITVEEQMAAAADTSELAAEAVSSARYSGVHEVARPGSRREEELRAVLQEEIAKESERQSVLAKVEDEAERARLVKFFTLEREEAKRRILALSNAAQAALYH